MATITENDSALKPSVMAALLLVALDVCRGLRIEPPRSTEEVLAATGASRSQGYELRSRLLEVARRSLLLPGGRPAQTQPTPDVRYAIQRAVLDYLYCHPGAAHGNGSRRTYSDGFRSFVVQLAAPEGMAAELTSAQLADAACIPLPTLKDWLTSRGPRPPMPEGPPAEPEGSASRATVPEESAAPERMPEDFAVNPAIATILAEYRRFSGPFSAFCDHLYRHHRLPYRRSFIATVLDAAGLRKKKHSRSQPVMAPWSRDTFERLFPGFQWLGDGTEVFIDVNGERFVFNLEALVDCYTTAITGIDVSDAESGAAVVRAIEHGKHTTGGSPTVLTLDNKPCNHTAEVRNAAAPATILPATPGRGQAKAAVEGTFGLLSQSAPPLTVEGDTPRQLARSIVVLLMIVWSLARNGRPRARLGGRSPAEVYHDSTSPTDDQLRQARDWLAELRRRADLARTTAERRSDPVRRQLIREALERHHIDDPNQTLELGIATYETDAIVRGIAIFDTKVARGSLPPHADKGRYLAGIVRHIHNSEEIEETSRRLLELRLRHRDLTLAPLESELTALRQDTSPEKLLTKLLEKALGANPLIDFRFYTRATAAALAALPEPRRLVLMPTLSRVIAAHFSVPRHRRDQIVADLTTAAISL